MVSGQYSNRPVRKAGWTALFAVWALLVFCPAPASLAEQAGPSIAGEAEKPPIIVTAKTLLADNKKKEVVYRTGVVVKRGDITLYADEVVIKLSDKKNSSSKMDGGELFSDAGGVDTIEARGGVKIVQGDKTATADSALYRTGDEEIVLTGNPRLWQGPNVLTGSRIVFSIKNDTITVDDAKTILYQGGGLPGPPGGVKP